MPLSMANQPTTALIVLGNAMFFQPEANVLSATLTSREEFASCLQSNGAALDSLDVVHIVVRSCDVSTLYDPDAVSSFIPILRPGAQMTVHALPADGGQEDEQTPVQPGDVDIIRMSLALAGLHLQVEAEGENGAWMLTARKKVEDDSEDDE